MAAADLTAQELRELLHYDPETGVFTWLKRRGSRAGGSIAGSPHEDGYIQIGVLGRLYGAHRLAWVYMHGLFPTGDVDHIDGVRSNNKIKNLRDVSRSVNLQNQRKPRSDNTSGFLGITLNVRTNTWCARIQSNGKQRNLGYFKTQEEAHNAYLAAKRLHHLGCTI